MPTPPTTAILLAAGSSRRMGQPKQLLPLHQTTLLNQTLHNLQQAHLDQLILVLGANAEAIQQQLPTAPNLTICHNPNHAEGMASSLQTGLRALSPNTETTLIVLADQPFIRPQTLHDLAHHPTNSPLLIPTHNGKRGNPIRLARALFPEAMQLKGDTGCRALFTQHPDQIELWETTDEGILLDLDTQQDYDYYKLRE